MAQVRLSLVSSSLLGHDGKAHARAHGWLIHQSLKGKGGEAESRLVAGGGPTRHWRLDIR